MLRRGDLFQVLAVVCPDCRGEIVGHAGGFPIRRKPEPAWCSSPEHPTFDATGRLVQATPALRGAA